MASPQIIYEIGKKQSVCAIKRPLKPYSETSRPKRVWVINPCFPSNRINESPPTKGGVNKCRIGIKEKNFLKGIFVLYTAYAYMNPIITDRRVEQIHSKKVLIAAFFQICIEKTCLKSSMSGESRTQIKGKRMKTVKKRKTANQIE